MGKRINYLIIQPHSDDALLNCGHLLFETNAEIHVLTVENDLKRAEEDRRLYDFLQIPVEHLPLDDFTDDSYYGFKKEYETLNTENCYEFLTEHYGRSTLDEIEDALKTRVTEFLREKRGWEVIAPWGINHPFHLFVRETLQSVVSSMKYYREFPHSYKRRAQRQVEEQRREYTLFGSYPVEEFHDVKFKLATKFYRTQSGFFFYEHGYIEKRLPEEVYVRKYRPITV